ncbi:MAG: hypothetical protein ACTSQI_22025 [Candidatus Helarchaeota archaeon]
METSPPSAATPSSQVNPLIGAPPTTSRDRNSSQSMGMTATRTIKVERIPARRYSDLSDLICPHFLVRASVHENSKEAH